jgi:Thioesterase-like superfamily
MSPVSPLFFSLFGYIVYQGRAGLLDSDYLGHLNNAAYLTHAELARWQMCASNGILQAVYSNHCAMLLTASAVRYRREIPIFAKFDVECYLAGIDDDDDDNNSSSSSSNGGVYIMHKFRNHHRPTNSAAAGGAGQGNYVKNRVLAQVLSRGVLVKNREVMDWRVFLKDTAGIDANVVDRLLLSSQIAATIARSNNRNRKWIINWIDDG